jgi:environmental stress-induced protein Ves
VIKVKEKIITKGDFKTTKWAGGETTQLAIYPEDANLADRDFLWRISSATFTGTESTFSDFSGYQRYLLPIEGELSVSHKGLYSRELKKYEVEYFDGGWETSSKNSLDCRDYNFIVKSGYQAKLQILGEGDRYNLKPSTMVTLFSTEDFEIELGMEGEKREIDGFSLYVLETSRMLDIRVTSASEPVIMTEFV